jgi:hypothetical protein
MPPASPKANTIKQWNPGKRIGMNRPAGFEPSGGDPVPYPEGGTKGDVGQTIFDKACRYDAADPNANCKAVFGPEWEWSGKRDNYDPWGHTDDEAGIWHYFCPAGSFFHQCRRSANTETDKHKCCIQQVHETRKNQTAPKTCSPKMRNYLEDDACFTAVYDHCTAKPDDGLSRLKEIASDPICINYAKNNKKQNVPEGYFNVLRRLCNTNNPKSLIKRLQEPGCKLYWENLKASTKVVDRNNLRVARDANDSYRQGVIKGERYKYCFDKNKKGIYHNLLKKCVTPEECHVENIPFDVTQTIDCSELCIDDSKNVDSSLRGKCDAAWKQYCKGKKFATFGSSDIDHKDLCPVYWENDKVRLAKVGELIRLAKEQKPDACAFSALTQVDYKKMEKQDPVCWYDPQRNSKINHNVHKFTGLVGTQEKCKSDSYNICCQKIQLEGELATPELKIEQNCPEQKLKDDNTITDMEGYEVPVPWVAPQFKPDPKCKDTPRPTGIVCEDPEEYPDFSGFMNDMIKFNADEIKEIVTSNWEKKQARDAAELAALEAEIAAMQSDEPGVKIDKEVKQVVERKKKLSFIERILEFFRKLFGGGKKKTKEQQKKEAEEEDLLEDFTNIPKKNKNLLMLVFVIIAFYIIYKILSNRHVQTGIGYGVGNVAGEAIGEGLYRNSDSIKRAGSSVMDAMSDVGSQAFNTFKSSGALDTIQDVGSGLLNTIGEVGSEAIEELL